MADQARQVGIRKIWRAPTLEAHNFQMAKAFSLILCKLKQSEVFFILEKFRGDWSRDKDTVANQAQESQRPQDLKRTSSRGL